MVKNVVNLSSERIFYTITHIHRELQYSTQIINNSFINLNLNIQILQPTSVEFNSMHSYMVDICNIFYFSYIRCNFKRRFKCIIYKINKEISSDINYLETI